MVFHGQGAVLPFTHLQRCTTNMALRLPSELVFQICPVFLAAFYCLRSILRKEGIGQMP